MRFRRLVSKGFGCLPNGFEWTCEPQGLTLIVGNNEMGKSTLVQALLAALYGEPKNHRDAKRRFIEAFTPWAHPDNAPELLLEVVSPQYGPLSIHRRFTAKSAAVHVSDLATRADMTRHFLQDKKTYAVGETLTGLSRAVFERSVLLLQNQIQNLDQPTDLVMAIEEVVDTGESGITAQTALKRLEAAERQIDPISGNLVLLESSLSRLSHAITQLQAEATQLQNEYQSYQQGVQQLAELEKTLSENAIEIQQAQSLLAQLEAQHLRETLRKQSELQAQVAQIQQEIDTLISFKAFPIQEQADLQAAHGKLLQLEQDLAVQQEQYQRLQHEMDALSMLPEVGQAVEGLGLLQQLLMAAEQLKRAADALSGEKERLLANKADFERFQKLHACFSQLPADVSHRIHQLCQEIEDTQLPWGTLSLQVEQAQEQLAQEKRRAEQGRLLGFTLLGLGGLVATLGIAFPGVAVALLVAGLILGVIGLFLLFLPGHTVGSYARHRDTLHHLIQQRDALLTKQNTAQETLRGMQVALNAAYPDMATIELPQDLLGYKSFQQTVFAGWMTCYQENRLRRQDVQSALAALKQTNLASWVAECSVKQPEVLIEQATLYINRLQQRDTLDQQAGFIRARIEALETQRATLQQTLLDQLTRYAGEPVSSVEAGLRWFEQAVAQYHHLQSLERLLAEKQQQLLSPQALQQLQAQLAQRASLEHHSSPLIAPSEDAATLRIRLQTLLAEGEQNKQAFQDLEKSLYAKQNHFHQRFPQIQEQLQDYNSQYLRYSNYQQALSVAQQTLLQAASQQFHQWSLRLNERVNQYLGQFGAPYGEVRFDTDLSFSLLDGAGRTYHQGKAFSQLSQGARDQFYLAVRLAITDYLSSKHGHLPLILDDPFVNFDDERFALAMTALAQAAEKGQQILVLTCHQHRHFNLFDKLAENYQGNVFLQFLNAKNPDCSLSS